MRFGRRTHIAEAERLKFQSVGVEILILMNRRSMDADFCTTGEMLTGWKGHSVFCDDFFHDATADETPHSHALAQNAVKGDHSGQSFLGPSSSGGFEFGKDFGAEVGDVIWEVATSSQVQYEVSEGDTRGLDDSKLYNGESLIDNVNSTKRRVVTGVRVVDRPLDVIILGIG
jgi:hypothetical protein